MKYLPYVVMVILVGLSYYQLTNVRNIKPKYVNTVRIDTVHDTVPITIAVNQIRVDTVYRTVNDTIKDTVYIPIIQKEYLTDNYHAWVSGYNVSLDSIKVFRKTNYITKEIVKYSKPKKFGIGIQVGCGVQNFKVAPYVGVGVSYNIIGF